MQNKNQIDEAIAHLTAREVELWIEQMEMDDDPLILKRTVKRLIAKLAGEKPKEATDAGAE